MGLFNDKTGLITGGSSGIGRATAIAFGREGANVVIADLEMSRAAAEETVADVIAQGGKAIFVPTDVSSARDVENLVAQTVKTFGGLDFAFNNAGVHTAGFTDAITEHEFDRVMSVDAKGVWLCLKYEIAHMKHHGGGVIVNAASVAGLVGTPQAAAYVAAKHAVVGLTKAAAGEFANMNIRINAVAPGAIATPMVLELPAETQASLMAPQPLQRLGQPEEVAEAVLWLCSSKSSFVLGTTLSVDGGATLNAQSYSAENSPSI